MPIIVGSWKLSSKICEFKVSGANKDVAPKQSHDRLPSVGDHIHGAPTQQPQDLLL